MTIIFFSDGVANPANVARIEDAARLLGAVCRPSIEGRLIVVENARGAKSVYGRPPLSGDATLAVGNERRGVSRRVLETAGEVVTIPSESRGINTLNVAAAAAVAGWYVIHGSAPQRASTRAELRRPTVLIVGDDHVEVGSTLRSAAAFGFRDVLLDDRGGGWFDGKSSVRREAYAAARRHKNSIRVHRSGIDVARSFDEIVVILPNAEAPPLPRERLAHGQRQLIVLGADASDLDALRCERTRITSLRVEPIERPPLRLTGSIALAEVARQVGTRRPIPGRPAPRVPRYELALPPGTVAEVVVLEPDALLEY